MNHKKFLLSSALFSFGAGMSGVYWLVRMNEIVGVEYFGAAIGITIISQSLASFLVGKYIIRHFKTLILAELLFAILTFAIILHPTFYFVFIIQVAFGIVTATQLLCSSVLIAKIGEKEKLGKHYGYFYSLQGIAAGVAMITGSYIVLFGGINSIFLIGAIIAFSASLLLYIDLPAHPT